jgi:hypothetical protein
MSIPDNFGGHTDNQTSPARSASAVTPHATNALTRVTKALYVGVSGDVVCRLVNDTADVTFVGVQAGSILPVRVTHVRATSTAGSIVALF